MEYIEILDGIVVGHFSAKKIPEGNQYKNVSNFTGVIGSPVEQLNELGEVLTKEEIIEKDILKPKKNELLVWNSIKWEIVSDYRNSDYWLKDTCEKVIFQIGDSPDNTMTDIEPPHPVAVWDQGSWSIPVKVQIEDLRNQRQNEFILFDKYQLPLLWNELPEEKREEVKLWRIAWLNVTDTMNVPERPSWFK